MADAGIKVYVEGEKEFKNALKEVDSALKSNKTEMRLLVEQYKNSDGSMDILTEQQNKLSETMEKQREKISLIETQMGKAAERYGENSKQVETLKNQMRNAKIELEKLSGEYEKNQQTIAAATEAQNSMADAIALSDAKIADYQATIKQMEAAMSGAASSADKFGDDAEAAAKKVAALEKENDILKDTISEQEKKAEALNKEMERAVQLYGKESVEALNYKTRITDTRREIEDLTRKIEKNNEAIEDAETPAEDLRDIFSELGESMGIKIPEGLGKLTEGFSGVVTGVGLAAGAAVEAYKRFEAFAEKVSDSAEELTNLADKMGITTEETGAWKQLMESMGYTVEDLDELMKDLNQSIYDATSKGDEEKMKLFQDLGVDVEKVNLSLEEMYAAIMDMSDEDIKNTLVSLEAELNGIDEKLIDADATLNKYGGDIKAYATSLWGIIQEEGEGGGAAEALKTLGINLGTAYTEAKTAIEIFPEMLTALQGVQNQTEKAGIMTALFGENWRNVTELFQYSGDMLEEKMASFEVYTSESTAALKQYSDQVDELKQRFKAAMEGLSGLLVGIKTGNKQLIQEGAAMFEANKDKILGWDELNIFEKMLDAGTWGLYSTAKEWASEKAYWNQLQEYAEAQQQSQTTTINNYNVQMDASSIEEIEDIARKARNARVNGRMGKTNGNEG